MIDHPIRPFSTLFEKFIHIIYIFDVNTQMQFHLYLPRRAAATIGL